MKKIILLLLLLAACTNLDDATHLKKDPVAFFDVIAKRNFLDPNEYNLRTVLLLGNGANSVVKPSRTDEFASDMVKKLNGYVYWEACYGTVKPMLGGDHCFYINNDDAKILFKYSGM